MEIINKNFDRRDHIKPLIFGVEGLELNSREQELFSEHNPLGFILFARNIDNPQQVKKLVNQLNACVFPRKDVLIMIDQEGGRVMRLRPPHWPDMPAAHSFQEYIEIDTLNRVRKLINSNYRICGHQLNQLGININCAPVLDLFFKNAHSIMGDRTLSADPYEVSELGKEICKALLASNVFPVIKHIPGHGRASCDSHESLPVIDASLKELREKDFVPFKALSEMPFAMTAHIIYSDIDKEHCATNSKKVIELIRNEIGFKNILFSDDITMKALTGTMAERSSAALSAGCDAILHCDGNYDDMVEICESTEYWKKIDRERYRDCWKALRY